MKKSVVIIFLLLMLFCAFSAVSAQDRAALTIDERSDSSPTAAEADADPDFEINSDGVLVKYHGKSAYIRIPDGVTAIGSSAFEF